MNAHLVEWSIRAVLMAAWTAWGPKLVLPILPEQGRVALEPIGDSPQLSPLPPTSTIPAQRSETRPVTPESAPAWPWARIVLGCYFAGAGVMLARLIAGTVRACALVRRATAEDGYIHEPRLCRSGDRWMVPPRDLATPELAQLAGRRT